VVGLADGKVREEDYSEQARKGLVPGLREFGLLLLKELEPLSSFSPSNAVKKMWSPLTTGEE
jgi:hypothetical protein